MVGLIVGQLAHTERRRADFVILTRGSEPDLTAGGARSHLSSSSRSSRWRRSICSDSPTSRSVSAILRRKASRLASTWRDCCSARFFWSAMAAQTLLTMAGSKRDGMSAFDPKRTLANQAVTDGGFVPDDLGACRISLQLLTKGSYRNAQILRLTFLRRPPRRAQ